MRADRSEPTRPTADDLAEWQRLAEAATPGPWASAGHGDILHHAGPNDYRLIGRMEDDLYGQWSRNAQFVISARRAVPVLLREGEILARETQAAAEWGTEILTAVAQRLGLSSADLDAARGDDKALEIVLGRLEEQTARLEALLPVARAVVALAGRWSTLDAGLRDPETPRDVLDDYTIRYDNALDVLGQAVSDLPDDVAAELEGAGDADQG